MMNYILDMDLKQCGYGTKEHLLGLEKYGVTPIHRRTFAPIKDMI